MKTVTLNKSSWCLIHERLIYNFLMSYVLLQVEFLKLARLVHIFIFFCYQSKKIEMKNSGGRMRTRTAVFGSREFM